MSDLTASTAIDAFMSLTDPGAVVWVRFNADNTVSTRTAANMRTDLGLVIGTDVQAYDADLSSWASVTRASGFDTFAATPTSANLRALITDEAGTGVLYFVGGGLGTPASGTLTNCSGLPVVGLNVTGTPDGTKFLRDDGSWAAAGGGGGGPITITGGTVTASTPVIDATQTWNNAAVTFVGIDLNVTNTASAAASKLIDLRVGGTSQFAVTRAGTLTVTGNLNGGQINATSFLSAGGSAAFLYGEAGNIWATRNGTAAQTFRVYNTFTSTSNQEMLEFRSVASNPFIIQTIKGSAGGTGRDLELRINGTNTAGTITNGTLAATVKATSIDMAVPLRKAAYTVGTLPGSPTAGMSAYVTDANAVTFASTVAGGGSNVVPVIYNGTNWIIA